MLSTLNALICLVDITTLKGKYYYYDLHFTDEVKCCLEMLNAIPKTVHLVRGGARLLTQFGLILKRELLICYARHPEVSTSILKGALKK